MTELKSEDPGVTINGYGLTKRQVEVVRLALNAYAGSCKDFSDRALGLRHGDYLAEIFYMLENPRE